MELAERVEALEAALDELLTPSLDKRYVLIDLYDKSFASMRDYLEIKADKDIISGPETGALADRVLVLERRIWFLRWQIQLRS